MGIIEFKNVSFSYSNEDDDGGAAVDVLENLSFSIEKGSFVAILGLNGSGKSTVAKLTNGILFPDSGEVIIDGQATENNESIFDIRRKVGMVFQNPDNQIVSSIVEEDVAFGAENLGIEPAEIRKRVDNALKTVGMYQHRLKSPNKLSGGQKQRVAVAGIIAMKPLCIVLDEPTAMLDPGGRREVIDTIEKLNKQENITILLITHFMDEAVKADRIIVLDNGRIVTDGAPRDVFSHVNRIKKIGLDVPQCTELIAKANIKSKQTVLDVNACADAIMQYLEG